MVKMVTVYRQSVAFCKYTLAALLSISFGFRSIIPVWITLAVMVVSAFTGVNKAPLVLFFNHTFIKLIKAKEEYINMYSMRFAHIVGAVFCVLALVSFYFISDILAYIIVFILAVMQTVASFGYCSAQKLYECVVCNNNCCNLGKRIKKHVR